MKSTSQPLGDSRRIPFVTVALLLLTLAAWSNSFSGPFVFDDLESIRENATIRRPGTALFPPAGGGLTVSGRPILNLTFAANYAISGSNVWSYHAVNLAIHVAAGLLLFGLVRRTLNHGSPASGLAKDALPLAATVTSLWMLHPLQTESVTYLAQRAESLAGLFILLTLYAFARSLNSPRPRRWLAGSICAALFGAATKETAATAPLLVLLYDRAFGAGSFRAAWQRRHSYYLALASVWLLSAALVASTAGRGGTAGLGNAVSPWSYLLTQAQAIAHYLRLTIWPNPLVFDYGTALVKDPGAVIVPGLLLLVLLGASLHALCRWPAAGFLGAWFFVTLAPSSSVIPVATQTMAEHRMYLPLAAGCAGLVLALHHWLGRRAWFVGAGLALAGGLLTYARNADYRSSLTLWADTVQRRPDNARAQCSLANALADAGQTEEALAHYAEAGRLEPASAEFQESLAQCLVRTGRKPEALGAYATALKLKPDSAQLHSNFAGLLLGLERGAEAITHYETAVRLAPAVAEFRSNLAGALLREHRLEEALAAYAEAVRLAPNAAELRSNLGNALAWAGRTDEAQTQFRTTLELDPAFAPAHNNLGNLLVAAGDFTEALAHYEAAVRIRPEAAEYRDNLGDALLRAGRAADALQQFEAASRLQPNSAEYAAHAGNALMQLQRYVEAVAHYEAALGLQPDLVSVHLNLGTTLVFLGRYQEARQQFNTVLALQPGNRQALEAQDLLSQLLRGSR